MEVLTGQHFIGARRSAEGKETFHAANPVTGAELQTPYYEAGESEVDEAARAAAEAFPLYRRKSGAERADFLDAIADEIMALGDQLIERCQAETGLPAARLTGERGRTVNQLKMFADLLREGSWVDARIDTADPDRQPAPKPDIRSMQLPLGPVAVFGASNFPLAFSVAGGDTASALAAGCPVVVKAHQAHPGTSELVALAIRRAIGRQGMPEGVFNMVHGRTPAVGQALVTHPAIKAVGFTGSFQGGKALFDAAARRPEPIPVYAEMGSTNPVFLLPAALAERGEAIAEGLAASFTLGTGQFCTNPGLVFVQESPALAPFRQLLRDRVSAMHGDVMLHMGIADNYRRGLERLVDLPGVSTLATGRVGSAACQGIPQLLQVNGKVFRGAPALEEEVFGPTTLLVVVSGEEEMVELARQLHGHLTATLWATEAELADYAPLVDTLVQKVGRLLVNGFPTGVEVCHAMVHGGPFPATTDARSTSVGTRAILRFTRPVAFQNFPDAALPSELREGNPLGISRLYNGQLKIDS